MTSISVYQEPPRLENAVGFEPKLGETEGLPQGLARSGVQQTVDDRGLRFIGLGNSTPGSRGSTLQSSDAQSSNAQASQVNPVVQGRLLNTELRTSEQRPQLLAQLPLTSQATIRAADFIQRTYAPPQTQGLSLPAAGTLPVVQSSLLAQQLGSFADVWSRLLSDRPLSVETQNRLTQSLASHGVDAAQLQQLGSVRSTVLLGYLHGLGQQLEQRGSAISDRNVDGVFQLLYARVQQQPAAAPSTTDALSPSQPTLVVLPPDANVTALNASSRDRILKQGEDANSQRAQSLKDQILPLYPSLARTAPTLAGDLVQRANALLYAHANLTQMQAAEAFFADNPNFRGSVPLLNGTQVQRDEVKVKLGEAQQLLQSAQARFDVAWQQAQQLSASATPSPNLPSQLQGVSVRVLSHGDYQAEVNAVRDEIEQDPRRTDFAGENIVQRTFPEQAYPTSQTGRASSFLMFFRMDGNQQMHAHYGGRYLEITTGNAESYVLLGGNSAGLQLRHNGRVPEFQLTQVDVVKVKFPPNSKLVLELPPQMLHGFGGEFAALSIHDTDVEDSVENRVPMGPVFNPSSSMTSQTQFVPRSAQINVIQQLNATDLAAPR